jgi:hypothetical protein
MQAPPNAMKSHRIEKPGRRPQISLSWLLAGVLLLGPILGFGGPIVIQIVRELRTPRPLPASPPDAQLPLLPVVSPACVCFPLPDSMGHPQIVSRFLTPSPLALPFLQCPLNQPFASSSRRSVKFLV